MRKIVKINAVGVVSKYGIVVDEDENVVLLKVGCKIDREKARAFGGFVLLGKDLICEV
jgi:hypothetical protein